MFNMYGFDKDEEIQEKELNEKLSDLKNPPSLEDILILDGTVNELQKKNKKLIKFFTKEKIKKMIDYIIKEPKDDDYNKGHKFPFVCSKLFNVEENNIMNYFYMTNKELSEFNKKENENNLSQNLEKDDNMNNINNYNYKDNDDINKYYKTGFGDNFEDDNYDEVNMDYIPDFNLNEQEKNDKEDKKDINNDNDKEKKYDNDEDNINYMDENDEKYIHDEENNKIEIEGKQEKMEDDLVNMGFIEDEKEDEDDEIVNINNNDKKNNNKINNMNDGYHDIITEKVLKEINDEKEYEDNNNIIENKIKNNEDKKEINIINTEDKENKEENKIEKIKEEYPEDQIELLDYFLSFVSTESELNYVLCGYFSSLMIILLNKNFLKIINYLFLKRKDILKKLVYHSYRKSIAETLCKIIKYEDTLKKEEKDEESYVIDIKNEEYQEKKFNEIRFEILKEIFNSLDIYMDTEKFSSISFILTNLSEDKYIFNIILNSKDLINSFINKPLSNLNLQKDTNDINYFNKKNNFIILCDTIIYWLNNIKNKEIQIPMLLYEVNDDFDDNDTVQQNEAIPEIHHTLLSQTLYDILPNLIKNNFNYYEDNNNNDEHNFILTSYNDEKIKPFGLHKIKIVELISHIIIYSKNISSEFDNLLIKSDFCTNAINYIFQYQNNNLYQEVVLQFFKNLFKKEQSCPIHELLFDHIFTDLNLLEKIKTYFPKEKNEGNSGIGYISFLVSLAYKLNSVINENLSNSNKEDNKQGNLDFMNRGRVMSLSGLGNIRLIIPYNLETNDNNNNTDDISISGLDKYCNEEWKYFFDEKIANKVKLYEGILYDKKNDTNDKDDLFLSPRGDNKIEKITDQFEGNKRYNNLNDIFFENNEDNDDNTNINDKNNLNKDMEININDFNFIINNINNNNEENKDINSDEDNKEFNDTNYWKNRVEENKNSYLSKIGEEAMKDLLE